MADKFLTVLASSVVKLFLPAIQASVGPGLVMVGFSLNPVIHLQKPSLKNLVASEHVMQSTPVNPGSQVHFLVSESHVPT